MANHTSTLNGQIFNSDDVIAMSETPCVYTVGDDAMLADIRMLLTLERLECQSLPCHADFLAEVDADSVGCVIVDIRALGLSGARLLQYVHARANSLSVIVLTAEVDVLTALRLMESSEVTLLQQPCCLEMLIAAIQRGLAGSRARWELRQQKQVLERRLKLLTEDEREVLDCLLDGMSNRGIASHLVLSERTVNRRRRAIMEKMAVDSLPKLCRLLYADQGLGKAIASPPYLRPTMGGQREHKRGDLG